MEQQYRQGDVLIVATRQLPAGLVPAPRDRGRIVLAEGEATGHAHAIAERGAILYEGDGEERFLEVETAVALRHEEHGAITLPPGTYRVIRQREYTPRPSGGDARWRYVAD
ncbi:MAG: hypothetical protein ACRD0K_12525 [Egibacteraceae bacterium]